MKKLRNMLVAVIAMVGLTTSAQSFEGWGVGGTLSFVDFSTSGSETANANGAQETGATSADKASTSVSKDVDIGSFFLEYTLPQGSTFGLEYVPGEGELGTKSRTDTASDSNEATDDSGTYTAKAELENVIQLYADIPLGSYPVYVKVGVQHVTLSTLESLNSGSTYPDANLLGYTIGLGVKGDIGSNMYYKVEAAYVDFEDYKQSSNSSVPNKVQAELEATTAKLSIGYKF